MNLLLMLRWLDALWVTLGICGLILWAMVLIKLWDMASFYGRWYWVVYVVYITASVYSLVLAILSLVA